MPAQRLLYWSHKLLALAGLTLAVFALPYCMSSPLLSLYESWPANPQQRLHLIRDYGFDRALPMQYAIWLQRLITGAWGTSRYAPRPVFQESWYATGHTLLLLAWVGMLCGVGVALWRLRQRRRPLQSQRLLTSTRHYILGALPGFLVAAVLREMLIGPLGWASLARLPLFDPYYFFHPVYMLLPATLLACSALHIWYWYLTSAPSAPSDMHASRYSWQQRHAYIWSHLEIFFLEVYLMEYVFSLPGLGKLGIEAVKRRDVPLLQGVVLCTGLLYLLIGCLCERGRASHINTASHTRVVSAGQALPLLADDRRTTLWPLFLLGGLTLSAPWLFWYDPLEIHSRDQFLAPGYRYLCGTDFLGRDLLSRTLGGFRSSLPRVAVLASVLASVHWLAGETIPGLLRLRHGWQRTWSASVLLLRAIPHFALAFMSFLVLESHAWALEISLILACLPAASRCIAGNATLFQRVCHSAWLGERLLMLEITFYFLNLSAESFAPTWGSDLRHGLHYGHTTVWMLVTPTLAITWSRYTLSRFGDAGQRAAARAQERPGATPPSDQAASAT